MLARVIVDEASDGNRPVGIITDRDLVIEVLAKGVDIAGLQAGDIMTPKLAQELGELAKALRQERRQEERLPT